MKALINRCKQHFSVFTILQSPSPSLEQSSVHPNKRSIFAEAIRGSAERWGGTNDKGMNEIYSGSDSMRTHNTVSKKWESWFLTITLDIVSRLLKFPHCQNLKKNSACTCRGWAVERQSLASVLSPSCARPVADGWPYMWVSRPL